MYKFLMRRQLVKNRAALFFGGAIHKALEVRDLLMKPLCDGEVHDAMVTALIDYYDGTDMDGDYRNLDYAVRTIDHYNTKYKFDNLAPILVDDKPAVEIPFALHVGDIEVNSTITVVDPDENDGVPFEKYVGLVRVMFTGKIDRLTKARGSNWIMDHKTTSIGGSTFFSEFYTALQFRGYKWAAENQFDMPFTGVIINGLICRPPTKDGRVNYDMDRHFIPINDGMVWEWQNTYMVKLQEWIGYIIGQDNYPDTPEQAFPLHTGACFAKYGQCEYFDVCSLDPGPQRDFMIQSGLFEDHSWSPLEDNAKPKNDKPEIDFGGLFDHLG